MKGYILVIYEYYKTLDDLLRTSKTYLKFYSVPTDRPAKDHAALIAVQHGTVIACPQCPVGADPGRRTFGGGLPTAAQPAAEVGRQSFDIDAGPTAAGRSCQKPPPGALLLHAARGAA